MPTWLLHAYLALAEAAYGSRCCSWICNLLCVLDTQPSAETCRVWLRRDSKHIVIMRLLIEGPSSAEAMRGTTMGLPNDKHAGTPAIVQKHYGHLRTAALSLAGWLQPSLLLSNVPIG